MPFGIPLSILHGDSLGEGLIVALMSKMDEQGEVVDP